MCAIFKILVVLLLAAASEMAAAADDFADIPGKFCESRPIPCCTSRQDNCKVPILGTMCYCDQFCDRSVNSDCCPDYRFVCLNQTRPSPPSTPNPFTDTECWHNGVTYRRGESLKINCNECKCERVCSSPVWSSCRMEMKCSNHVCLVDPELVTQINLDRSATWKAANYSDFWGHTLDEGFGRRLGTRHSKRRAYSMRPITATFDRERVRAKVNYDLRAEKPGLVSPPLNQGWCAADWVISTVQVATDRLAIVSKGEDRAFLSPQHLLSCNAKNQRGCDGGHITRAWKFVQKFGLVPEACYPWEGRLSNCSISKLKDKTRTTARCANGNDVMSLHRTGPAYRVSKDPEAIMHEIMTSGPVQATMKVTRDFFNYRSGVYQCSRFSRNLRNDTYHSVRIVGWGEQVYQGTLIKYWIVSNSWGTWWGESGYFRIRRGVNDCEIESLVLGAWINPNLLKKDPSMPMMDKTNDISNTILYRT